MTVLWEAYLPMTVREVHQELARERHRDLAYTTVMTVLDRLAKKGVVRQIKDGRAYRYAPVQSRAEMTAALMMDALSGTPDRDAALAHFVGQLPPEALHAALGAIQQDQTALGAIQQDQTALEGVQQDQAALEGVQQDQTALEAIQQER